MALSSRDGCWMGPRTSAVSNTMEQMAWQALALWFFALPTLKPDQVAAQIQLWVDWGGTVESREGEVDLHKSIHVCSHVRYLGLLWSRHANPHWIPCTILEKNQSPRIPLIAWPGSRRCFLVHDDRGSGPESQNRTNELLGNVYLIASGGLWSPKDSVPTTPHGFFISWSLAPQTFIEMIIRRAWIFCWAHSALYKCLGILWLGIASIPTSKNLDKGEMVSDGLRSEGLLKSKFYCFFKNIGVDRETFSEMCVLNS